MVTVKSYKTYKTVKSSYKTVKSYGGRKAEGGGAGVAALLGCGPKTDTSSVSSFFFFITLKPRVE